MFSIKYITEFVSASNIEFVKVYKLYEFYGVEKKNVGREMFFIFVLFCFIFVLLIIKIIEFICIDVKLDRVRGATAPEKSWKGNATWYLV